MKKYLVFIIVAIGMVYLTFQSCKQLKQDCDCEAPYTNIDLKINGNHFKFKDYGHHNGTQYISTKITYKNVNKLIKFSKDYGTSANNAYYRGNNDQLVGMFYIIDGNKHTVEENTNLTTDIVDGAIEYFLREGKLLATAYKKENGNFNATVIEDLETKIITSNDIYNISKEVLSISEPIVIAVLTDINYITADDGPGLLYYATKKDRDIRCAYPCTEHINRPCNVTYESCGGIVIDVCKFKQYKTLLEANNIIYDFTTLLNDARNFRDAYLKKHKGGIILIKLYYDISKNMVEDADLQFAVETYNKLQIFNSKINSLTNSPNSRQILFTEQDIDIIIQYLNDLKQHIDSTDLQRKIDKLIILADNCKNKTNEEVTQFIDRFNFN